MMSGAAGASQHHWHSVYASDVLSRRRKKTHLQKLKKIGLLNLPRNLRILDVACGEGEMLDLLAEAGFVHLTGLDPFESLRNKEKKWRFVRGNAGALPFEAGDFDVILCAHALHHLKGIEEIRDFLKGSVRVLVPSGRLLIIDHFDSPQLRLAHFLLMSPLAKLGAWTSEFHDQLCSERAELDYYLDHYPWVRKAVLGTSFPYKKWQQDIFFFYFEGKRGS